MFWHTPDKMYLFSRCIFHHCRHVIIHIRSHPATICFPATFVELIGVGMVLFSYIYSDSLMQWPIHSFRELLLVLHYPSQHHLLTETFAKAEHLRVVKLKYLHYHYILDRNLQSHPPTPTPHLMTAFTKVKDSTFSQCKVLELTIGIY